jgi:hypothetical protein
MNCSLNESKSESQYSGPESAFSPLDLLVTDLGALRDGLISKDHRRRSAILAGQLLILAREYRTGRRPNRRTLKRFFHFVAREQAAA